MWKIAVTGVASATKEVIWAWYEATNEAPKWDPLIKRITPDGPIRTGVTGRNYPTKGPSGTFKYTEVTPLVSYTEVTKLPGANAAFTHELSNLGDSRTRIMHGAELSGPLAGLYGLLMKKQLHAGMQTAMDNFVRTVEGGLPPAPEK